MRTYAIKNIFRTIQGEGINAGRSAVFIRFAGCNAWNGKAKDRAKGMGSCALWCDSDFVGGPKLTVKEVVEKVGSLTGDAGSLVVLTGGEPTLQFRELDPLLCELYTRGHELALETNGSRELDATTSRCISTFTLSPKLGVDVHPAFLSNRLGGSTRNVRELKVVLPGTISGGGWSSVQLIDMQKRFAAHHVFVQPLDPLVDYESVDDPGTLVRMRSRAVIEDKRREYARNLERCVEFVHAFPEWRISLQTHKYAGWE